MELIGIDPNSLWTHTGTASLILGIIWYLSRQVLKCEKRAELAEERERATRNELAEQTLALTRTYQNVTAALSVNAKEHRIITEALRHLIVKEEVRNAIDNQGA